MHAVGAKHILPHQPTVEEFDNPEDLDSPSIETGTLAISIQSTPENQTLKKGFWVRPYKPQSYQPPENNGTLLRFEIQSAQIMPLEDGSSSSSDLKIKRYVVYELTVRQDSQVPDPQPVQIQRRYTDFRELFNTLKQQYPQALAQRYFPNKVLMGNFSFELIAERADAFENFLAFVASHSELREAPAFLRFLQHQELSRACQFVEERRNELAIPILENCFRLINKIFMDRSKPVLLLLCRLVAACSSSPVPHHAAERWATLALARFETLCDIDLLALYIPLLHTCAHLWWQRGQDQKPITDRLTDMSKQGINTKNSITLMEAIHKIDPRTATI